MRALLAALALGIGLAGTPAWAQEPTGAESSAEGATAPPDAPTDDELDLLGKKLDDFEVDTSAVPTGWDAIVAAQEAGDTERAVVLYGAQALQLPVGYVEAVREGLEYIYRRDYKGARRYFEKLEQTWDDTAIAASIDTLAWQALMLENFDFRYDKQYRVANKAALKKLERLGTDGAHDGWEQFQLAGLKGVEAIHMVRTGKLMPALERAFEAMEHIATARTEAPNYVDLGLADGMYNYWRTVITMNSSMLPDFGDQRPKGIAQLQTVRDYGLFMRAPAALALAFSWLEARDYDAALEETQGLRAKYPTNVINNLLTANTLMYKRRHEEAIALYDQVLSDSPRNNRAHYYKGITLSRMNKRDEAMKSYERYLASDHLEPYQVATTHYRVARLFYAKKDYEAAEKHYKMAIRANDYAPAKRALARMREKRRKDQIDF